ncbi:MAG: DUF58 domain-containing protein [Phycisphaerales bacterium]
MAESRNEDDRRSTGEAGHSEFQPLEVAARRYHFHGPLLVYVVTTVVLVFGAINGQNNLLFWLFGLAVGGLIVSGFLSGSALMGIHVERELPGRGEVGEPMRVRYRVRNSNFLFPACAMLIEEIERGPGGRSSLWKSTFPRCETFLPRVEAGSSQICTATTTPRKRGEVAFLCVRVSTTFPFGLTRKSVVFAAESRTLVRPMRVHTPRPQGNTGVERSHELASNTRARDGEFFGLREYSEGDPARLIAWRATAKLGRPIVREAVLPPARRELVLLDLPEDPAALEAVVSVGAGLAERLSRDGVESAVGLTRGGLLVPFGRGPRHLSNSLDALARLEPGDAAIAAPVTHAAVTVVHAGGAPASGVRQIDASSVPGVRVEEPSPGDAAAPTLRSRLVGVWDAAFGALSGKGPA